MFSIRIILFIIHYFLKSIRITLILSHPFPSVLFTFGLNKVSSNPSQILPIFTFLCICMYTQSIICQLVFVSQIPSQPRIAKSVLLDIQWILTSGNEVTAQSWRGIRVFFLCAMSPIARERFRFPSILPSTFTVDPAL